MLIRQQDLRAISAAHRVLRADDDGGLDHDDDRVTVAALARQAEMPRARFIATFAALYGTTPHQLRIASRIAKAQRLLDRGEPVTDVCMLVGCSSLGSFSAAFKQRTGLSPSQWQKKQGQVRIQVPVQVQRRPIVGGCFGLLTALPASAFR